MRKLLTNRLLAIICLVILVYGLSILIEKRISSGSSFDFKLWSPIYLILAILIPAVILLPLKYYSASRYADFVFQREKQLKTITILFIGILLVWFLAWYAFLGVGKLADESLKLSEANETAITYLKNDSIVQAKIGSVDSVEEISSSLSSKVAKYSFIIYGRDTRLSIDVLLSHEQKWIVDTLIIN